MRAGAGVYVRPGRDPLRYRGPSVEKMIEAIAEQRETIASHGAAAANALGLTTQVPIRDGISDLGAASRQLKLGLQTIELRNAPGWSCHGRPTRR